MIELAIHTDNWRVLSGSYKKAVSRPSNTGSRTSSWALSTGSISSTGWGSIGRLDAIESPRNPPLFGPARDPHLANRAAYPMMGPDGSTFGVQYVQQAIRFAPNWAPADRHDRRPGKNRGLSATKRSSASPATTTGSCSPGPKTTRSPSTSNRTVPTPATAISWSACRHFESEYLRFNFDTGNTYIAGLDPLAYLKRFRKYLTNSHIKDVSAELAATAHGEDTGIACSEVAVGEGVNAENIAKCIGYLRETNWSGVVCIECSGSDQKIEKSVAFMQGLLK